MLLGRSHGFSLFVARSDTRVDLYESHSGERHRRDVWSEEVDPEISRVERVTLHKIGPSRIVEVFECLNGTGGCYQEFLAWSPGVDCRAVDHVRDKFNAALPRPLTTLKAPIADLDAMTIRGNGWKPSACNACPSLEMTCRLTFDGDAFHLSKCAVKSIDQGQRK